MRKPCSGQPSLAARRVAPAAARTCRRASGGRLCCAGKLGKSGARLVRPGDGKPAEFVLGILNNARAERIGDQLRAEANADDPFALRQGGFDERAFRFQPGPVAILVNIHLAAHDHEEVEGVERGQGIAAIEMMDADGVAMLRRPGRDFPRTFKGGVLEDGDVHVTT